MRYIKKAWKGFPYPPSTIGVSKIASRLLKLAKKAAKTQSPAEVRDLLADTLIETLHELKNLREKAPTEMEKGKGGATKEKYSRTIAYVTQVLNAVLDSKVKLDEVLRRLAELEKQVSESEKRRDPPQTC